MHGTTGYEWLNVITPVLVDGSGLEPLDEIWRQVSNTSPTFEPVLKRRQAPRARDPAGQRVHRADAAAGAHRRPATTRTRDYSADSLRQALELFVLHFPVYRTYRHVGRRHRRTTAR